MRAVVTMATTAAATAVVTMATKAAAVVTTAMTEGGRVPGQRPCL